MPTYQGVTSFFEEFGCYDPHDEINNNQNQKGNGYIVDISEKVYVRIVLLQRCKSVIVQILW